MDKFEVKLDQAARAAWMSYVGGITQDEIAQQLGVSRPGVQRLLALARQEGLVKVRIDHPIAAYMAMGDAIREHFDLDFCDVVPAEAEGANGVAHYLAVAGAERMARLVERHKPLTLALGTLRRRPRRRGRPDRGGRSPQGGADGHRRPQPRNADSLYREPRTVRRSGRAATFS